MIGETMNWQRYRSWDCYEYRARENDHDLVVFKCFDNRWGFIIDMRASVIPARPPDQAGDKLARQARKAAEEKFYELGLNIPF